MTDKLEVGAAKKDGVGADEAEKKGVVAGSGEVEKDGVDVGAETSSIGVEKVGRVNIGVGLTMLN